MPRAPRLLLATTLLLAACGGDDVADATGLPPVGAAGIGSADLGEAADGDTWMNRYDAILRDMLAVLQGVTDSASAEAAVPEMEALGERLAALQAEGEREGGLGLAAQATGNREAWAAAGVGLSKVQPLLTQEFMRLGMDPALRPHLDDLTDAMGDAMRRDG